MNNELNKEIFDKMMAEMLKDMPKSPFGNFMDSVYKPMKIELPEPEPYNNFRFTSRMWGIPVYTSNYLPTIAEIKVRGIPSSRKPNTRRPFYRKVTIKKTSAYLINGKGIVAPVGFFASGV